MSAENCIKKIITHATAGRQKINTQKLCIFFKLVEDKKIAKPTLKSGTLKDKNWPRRR